MEILKRTISAVLALVLVVGMLPMPAGAVEGEQETAPVKTVVEAEETAAPEEAAELAEPAPETTAAETIPAETVTEITVSTEAASAETVPETEASTEPAETVPETTEETVPDPVASEEAPQVLADGPTCGENLTWSFDSTTGTLTIEGSGEMTSANWKDFRDWIKVVVLPDGLTSICADAFAHCKVLTSITIPDSVTYIGDGAFRECSVLSEVKLPANLNRIENHAFVNCVALTEITIPKKLESAGHNWYPAFAGCTALTTAYFEEGLAIIPDNLFKDCISLKKAILPNSLTSIGNHAFRNCTSLETVVIPDNCLSIGTAAYAECTALTSVTMGAYTMATGLEAFKDCTALTEVKLNNALTEVSNESFLRCTALKEIVIPGSVTRVGDSAFRECTALTDVKLPTNLETLGNYAFRDCTALAEITIPKELKNAGHNWYPVFTGCTALETAYLEEGLTTIPDNLFKDCTSLKKVDLLYSVTSVGNHAFRNCTSLETVVIPDACLSIGTAAYAECTALTSVTMGAYTIATGLEAFKDCTALTEVKLNNALTEVSNESFLRCTALKEIVIPDSVTRVGDSAFQECTALTDIKLSANLETLGNYAFRDCTALAEITIPKELKNAGHNWYPVFTGCTALETAYLEEGLTAIPDNLFKDCMSLKKVDLLYSVTSVGNHAFRNCTSLETVVIPDACLSIGTAAYAECTALTSVTMGAYTMATGLEAFKDCTALTEVKLNNALTEVSDESFLRCTALKEIVIPDSVTRVGDSAFQDCTALTNVKLSAKLDRLGNYAFRNCVALAEITIPKTLTSAGHSWYPVFTECTAMKTATLEDGTVTVVDNLFKAAVGLEKVNIPNTVVTIGTHAFRESGLLNVTLPESVRIIKDNAFGCCGNLIEVIFPEEIHTIEPGAFNECDSLLAVNLPDALTKVDSSVFYGCNALTTVDFPEGLSRIEANAFAECDSLQAVVIPDNVTYIGTEAFAYCDSMPSVTIGNSVQTIDDDAFRECMGLKTVTLGENLYTIEEAAFYDCEELETVVFTDSITEIKDDAFGSCDLLKEVKLGANLRRLGHRVFSDCDSLALVEIGDEVTYIGDECFYDCDGLKTVTMGNAVQKMGHSTFEHCDTLENVTLSINLDYIPEEAFRECAQLVEIVIPYYAASIGDKAFNRSPRLVKVVTSANLSSIGTEAFSYPNLTVFYGVTGSYTNQWCDANGYKFVGNTVPATGITLNETVFNLARHGKATIIPNIEPVDFADAIVYKSTNNEVATVDAEGNIIAGDICGTCKIKVTVGKVSAMCTVNVIEDITGVKMSESKRELYIYPDGTKDTFQLTAIPKPEGASYETIQWTSSDENVAVVDENGLVTADNLGTTVITATLTSATGTSHSAECVVTVKLSGVIEEIKLDKTVASMQAMEQLQLSKTITPAECANNPVIWSSTNEAVATVDQNGVVTGVSKGIATITVVSADGGNAKASCSVTVTNNAVVTTDKSQLESNHPYESSCTDFWIYTEAGAQQIELTFDSQTNMEESFDFLHIYDGQGNLIGTYTGTELAGQTITIPGDTVKIQLETDSSGVEWGFKVVDAQPEPTKPTEPEPSTEPTTEPTEPEPSTEPTTEPTEPEPSTEPVTGPYEIWRYEWEENGHTYALIGGCDYWGEAKAYCESVGGYLATLTTEKENQLMAELGVENAYFGFTDEKEEDNWQWVTGETVGFTHWNVGEPNVAAGYNYAKFNYHSYDNGTWSAGFFDSKPEGGPQLFLCEWGEYSIDPIEPTDPTEPETEPTTEPTEPETEPTIPPTEPIEDYPEEISYIEFDGHRYALMTGCDSWESAKEYCESVGGYLATITYEEENLVLCEFIWSTGVENAFFGFSDAEEEGVWKWVTGETVNFTNWAPGEPNSEHEGEDYAMFYQAYADGTWNDGQYGDGTVGSGYPLFFLCEWGDYTIEPDDPKPTEPIDPTGPEETKPGDPTEPEETKPTEPVTEPTEPEIVPSEIYIENERSYILDGKKLQLKAYLVDSGEEIDVTWFVEDGNDCASITQKGILSAHSDAEGVVSVEILARAEDGGEAYVTLEILPADTRLILSSDGEELGDSLSVDINEVSRLALTAELEYVGETDPISWSTSQEAVAVVAEDGLVTLTGEGTAVITARGPYGITGSVELNVRMLDYSPRLGNNSITLNPMQASGAEVTLVPSYGNDIVAVWLDERFSADYGGDIGVLTISASDLLKNGKYNAVLNVECENGVIYTFAMQITVKSIVPSVTVRQNEKMDLFYTDSEATFTITAKDAEVEYVELIDNDDFYMEDGVLRFTNTFIKRYRKDSSLKPDTKATVLVYLEGYQYPVEKGISIATAASKLNLVTNPTASAVNTALSEDHRAFFFVCDKSTKEPIVLTEDDVIKVTGDLVESYNVEDNGQVSLSIIGSKSGNANIYIRLENWMQTVKLTHKVTIDTKVPTVKLGATTLQLSSIFPKQTSETSVELSHGNLEIQRFNSDNFFVSAAKKGTKAWNEAAKMNVYYDGDKIVAEIIDPDNAPAAGNYSFTGTPVVGNSKLKDVTIKVNVSSELPKAKLSTGSVKLNTLLAGDEVAELAVTLDNKTGYTMEITGFKGIDEHEEQVNVVYYEDKLHVSLADEKTGKYDFQLIPVVQDTEGSTAELAPVKLTVQSYEKAITVAQAGKGKLDCIDPSSEIVYTISKVGNALGMVEAVELEEGSDLFELSSLATDDKGKQSFSLTLRDNVTYSTKESYQLQLKYTICGREILSNVIKIKVTQSNLKVTAPAVNYYQAQSLPLNVKLSVVSPAAAKLEQVAVSDKSAKELLSALGAWEFDGENISIEITNPSALTVGKTYKLVLDITPAGQSENAKLTQVTVNVKVGK